MDGEPHVPVKLGFRTGAAACTSYITHVALPVERRADYATVSVDPRSLPQFWPLRAVEPPERHVAVDIKLSHGNQMGQVHYGQSFSPLKQGKRKDHASAGGRFRGVYRARGCIAMLDGYYSLLKAEIGNYSCANAE